VNPTLYRALLLAMPVAALLIYTASTYVYSRTAWSLLLFIGGLCFSAVVVTHIAEALRAFRAMGWGDPHSVGHYIDLTSAVAGVACVVVGVLLRVVVRRIE